MKTRETYWLAGSFVAAALGSFLIVTSEIRDQRILSQYQATIVDDVITYDVAVANNTQKQTITPAPSISKEQPVVIVPVPVVADTPKTKKSLADYPGFGGDFAADELRFNQEEQQREAFIASCMHAQGYVYQPAASILVDMDITTDIEDLVASLQDPNESYVASLGQAEREYYYTALVGVTEPNALEADELPDFTNGGGCVGEALRQIPGVYVAKNELRDEYNDMASAIENDPRIEEARMVWVRCMQGKGYDFESPVAVFDEIESYYLEQTQANQAINDEYYQTVIMTSEACEAIIAPIMNEVSSDYERKFVKENNAILNTIYR